MSDSAPPIQPTGLRPPRMMTAAPPYAPESFASLRNWFFGFVAASIIVCSVLIVVIIGLMVAAAAQDEDLATVMFAMLVGTTLVHISVGFVATVIYMMLLYRAWNQIQDGFHTTTPGLAVGLLFIPCFNLYWMFIAHWKLTEDFNAYIRRHDLAIAPANTGTALTFCILYAMSAIFGLLVFLVAIVFLVIMLNDMVRISSEIADARRDGLTHAPVDGTRWLMPDG